MIKKLKRDDVLEKFRNRILEALDETAEKELFGSSNNGWRDAELPELFKAIDAHVDKIAERSNVILTE